jgi:dienelactone hydrolase
LLSLALFALCATSSSGQVLFGPSGFKKTVTCFEHNKQKVCVWQYEPKAKGKHPALVMLYGMDCLTENPKHYEFIAERFAAKGYVVALVHYFDCTKIEKKDAAVMQARLKASLTDRLPREHETQVKEHFQCWVAAAKAGVHYVRTLPSVDGEQVAMVGFSLGGFVAMSLIATEPGLDLAAVVQCFGGLPRELHPNLMKAPPVLIFHGDKDDIVPVKEAHDLKALMKERNLHVEDKIYEGVGHMFLNEKGVLRLDRVFDAERVCLAFLEKHVKNGKKDGK